jgi:hypothetical protein
MANNITNLKLSSSNRGILLNINTLSFMEVNFRVVNLPGGGIASVRKYKITCSIAEVRNTFSRNVTLLNTLSQKYQDISIGDVALPGDMKFKFKKSELFPNGRTRGGTFAAIITISAQKGIVDTKLSNLLTISEI